MYHPAALERAADSIKGVETQGLGRSWDGRLPIFEDYRPSLGLLSMLCGRLVIDCSRIVVGSNAKGVGERKSFAW